LNRLVWYVAIGSAAGGASRLLLGTLIQGRTGGAFPLGTLIINISGSLVLGFLMKYTAATPGITPEIRALMTTGFCGGYTTFSTYSFETATLIEDGRYSRASLYILLSVGVSLLGTFGGFAAARELLAVRGRG
jgi:fluoride exporter